MVTAHPGFSRCGKILLHLALLNVCTDHFPSSPVCFSLVANSWAGRPFLSVARIHIVQLLSRMPGGNFHNSNEAFTSPSKIEALSSRSLQRLVNLHPPTVASMCRGPVPLYNRSFGEGVEERTSLYAVHHLQWVLPKFPTILVSSYTCSIIRDELH